MIHYSARDIRNQERGWFYVEFGIPYLVFTAVSMYLLSVIGLGFSGLTFFGSLILAFFPANLARRKLDGFFNKISKALNS